MPSRGRSFPSMPWVRGSARALLSLIVAWAAVVWPGIPASAAAPCTKHWTGVVSVAWTTAGNWSPSGQPGSADYACVDNSVSVTNEPTIGSAASITLLGLELQDSHTLKLDGSLTLTGTGGNASMLDNGTIKGAGALTLSGDMDWLSGVMRNTGTTTVAGGGTLSWTSGQMLGAGTTTVSSGGTLAMTPNANQAIDIEQRTLQIDGSASLAETVQGSDMVLSGGDCTSTTQLVIGATGTFALSSDAGSGGLGIEACGPASISNHGTFSNSAGSAGGYVRPPLTNTGIVSNLGGTLVLDGGGGSGTFSGGSFGWVELESGTFMLKDGAQLSGVVIDNYAVVDATAGATVTLAGTDRLDVGAVMGGTGTFRITGTLHWTDGTMADPGSTIVPSGGTIDVEPGTQGFPTLSQRFLTVNGSANLTEVAGGIGLDFAYPYNGQRAAAITVGSSGTFSLAVQGSGDYAIYGGSGQELITNKGTFVQTVGPSGSCLVGSPTTISIPFVNDGVVKSLAGTLYLAGQGTGVSTGTFGGGGGTVCSFAHLGNGAKFTTGSDVGGYIDGSVTAVGTVGLFGIYGGAGTLTVKGTMNWSDNEYMGSGPGSTVVASTGHLNISAGTSGELELGDRPLVINGTASMTATDGAYGLSLFGDSGSVPSTITNNGTFTYSGPSGPSAVDHGIFTNSTSATGQIVNNGTFTKIAGDATTPIAADFDNNGTLNVSSGILKFQEGFAAFDAGTSKLTKGTYKITSPGVLEFPNAAIVTNAANLTLTGGTTAPIRNASGVDALSNFASNTGSLTIKSRTLAVKPFTNSGTVSVGLGASGGALSSSGGYTQTAGTTVLAAVASKLVTAAASGNVGVNAGTLSGIGTVQTPFSTTGLSNSGVVSAGSPSSATGTLTLTGKYTQAAGGTLLENVAGTGAGQFDRINASQSIALAGTLNIVTAGSYTATVGDTFTILSLSAGTVTGTFATVTGTDTGNGHHYTVVYHATNVQLVVQ